jgi:hypothetical protein
LATAFVADRIIGLTGEMVKINRASVGRIGLIDQLERR